VWLDPPARVPGPKKTNPPPVTGGGRQSVAGIPITNPNLTNPQKCVNGGRRGRPVRPAFKPEIPQNLDNTPSPG